jgi:hypothetical protein
MPNPRPHTAETPIFSGSNITSVEVSPLVAEEPNREMALRPEPRAASRAANAKLMIERGDAAGTEFAIVRDESIIGRWDADNGIFPDVDLDSFDQEAKVSRRHARVLFREGSYLLEDLGSTNGTYVNRGRRLLPGTPQELADGDEIIVGKTFLRFKVIG